MPPQSFEEAGAPLAEDQQEGADEDFSLQFHLGGVKSGLSEVRDKMEDIRMGEVRSRGSGESQRQRIVLEMFFTRSVGCLSAPQSRLVT